MSNAETPPIRVRSLAEWAQVKENDAVARAEKAEEETTQMPAITLHSVETDVREMERELLTRVPARGVIKLTGTEGPSKLEMLSPAQEFVNVGESTELVGVEENLTDYADLLKLAADAQGMFPSFIIWYGQYTEEFWVLGEELTSYGKYSDMIQGLNRMVPATI